MCVYILYVCVLHTYTAGLDTVGARSVDQDHWAKERVLRTQKAQRKNTQKKTHQTEGPHEARLSKIVE